MHPNPAFRGASAETNLAFARTRGFGMLTIADAGGGAPLAAHIPFVLDAEGTQAALHLVRSNPIAAALRAAAADALPALLAVTGPDGYISPDWYGLDDQVPTWNYIAVHLRGRLSLRPEDELPELLDRLSARFEADLAPKPAWTRAKMTPEVLTRMMRQILPCRLDIEQIDGTWKLSQNKPEAARLGAAASLAARAGAVPNAELADLMRAPLPPRS